LLLLEKQFLYDTIILFYCVLFYIFHRDF